MPYVLDSVGKQLDSLSKEFDKEKQVAAKATEKLAAEIKSALHGADMPKKWFERDIRPIIESAKKMEDARIEIQSQEQTIKRLERQMELLQKELAALKKDALTEADIKPFKSLLK